MQIGIIGKTNVGKSTFFRALTLANVEISNRPFTTLKANVGIGYVKVNCPCKEYNVKCNPKDGYCINGKRFVQVKLIDVPGLIPGASKGRGLGNKFLDDLRQADAFILVIDASGRTDEEGNPTIGYNPVKDVEFVWEELYLWFKNKIEEKWEKLKKYCQVTKKDFLKELYKNLTGLSISYDNMIKAIKVVGKDISGFDKEDISNFAKELLKISKPFIVVANKIDLKESKENWEKIRKEIESKFNVKVFPASSESEVALKLASRKGLIKYIPGESEIEVIGNLNEKQKKAIEYIKREVIDIFGSTGVQNAIDYLVFEILKWKVVFPVENENKLSDKNGNILPNAILLWKDARAIDLAFKIHEDIGKNFKRALIVNKKKIVGKDYVLENRDIVKIFI